MTSVNGVPVESEIEAADPEIAAPVSPAGFRMFNRITDWITSDRTQLINVTDRINEIVRKSGIRDGMVHLQSLHTTTAVFINEWQDALLHDVKSFLDDLVNSDCERKNADSHLRGMIMGQTLCLQVRNSCVLLGTWQSIILAEFDGPRSRSVSIQVSGI
jgi:secondary thiamine-phosphate synthase enzyme